MRVACVVGTRPNFMKIKPVIDGLERRGVAVTLVHTGQHYDMAMSQVFFDELGLDPPDHHLGVGAGSHAEQTARVMMAFEPVLEKLAPDGIVVVGDVNSTMAAALVAAKASVPVAHVEAGLRSGDWTMPEEVNRVVTDRVSDLLLAPSPDAVDNLRAEGHAAGRVHLVGNVMIDTLMANLDRAKARPVLDRLGLAPKGYGLVTLHRPATVDDPGTLRTVMWALSQVGAVCPLILPAHPRAAVNLGRLTLDHGLRVIEPLGYLDFLAVEASARLVLSDSGGVQEETTVLGVPCLTLRDNTERPITVTDGTNKVIGRDPDRIVAEAMRILRDGVAPRRPALWDGRAGLRVAEVLTAAWTQP